MSKKQSHSSTKPKDFTGWSRAAVADYLAGLEALQNLPPDDEIEPATSNPPAKGKTNESESNSSEESSSEDETSEEKSDCESNSGEIKSCRNSNSRLPQNESSSLSSSTSNPRISIMSSSTTTTDSAQSESDARRRNHRIKRKLVKGFGEEIEKLRCENSFDVMQASNEYPQNEVKCIEAMKGLAKIAFCQILQHDIPHQFQILFPPSHFILLFIR